MVHASGQVFEVDLVHDADAGRDDLEGVECLHAPLHELIAFLVALELQFHVQVECIGRTEVIDHDRVVDHKIDRYQRFNALGIAAHCFCDIAH